MPIWVRRYNHFITLKRTRVSKNDFLESGPEDFVENATLTTTVTIKYSGNNATFSSLPTGVSVIVFQKVCKFQFIYFCNRTVKNNLLWNLHLSK